MIQTLTQKKLKNYASTKTRSAGSGKGG